MNSMPPLAAIWLLVSGVAFFVSRFMFVVRLARARVGLRVMWSGMPGYVQRVYWEAPERVRARLHGTYRAHEVLKWVFVVSVPLTILIVVAVTARSSGVEH